VQNLSEERAAAALYVVSAPSGAGKTSLVKAALDRDPRLRLSISHTTRKRREHEVDSVHYFFVDRPRFDAMVAAGEFLEHAEVFDNFYGTGRAQVQRLISEGHPVILEIDWQGARQVRAAMPDAVTVFVLPPSREELERRLRDRKTDSDAVIARRLRDAVADMGHWNEFDYVIVNEDFEAAVRDFQVILAGHGEALRGSRPELRSLLGRLLAA
jgi:guanylate kinase